MSTKHLKSDLCLICYKKNQILIKSDLSTQTNNWYMNDIHNIHNQIKIMKFKHYICINIGIKLSFY